MSKQKEDIWNRNAEESLNYSIIRDPKYCRKKRMALVRSMTDRLQLTLDDIRNSVNSDKLNSLSFVPQDLVPFEINLADGQKIMVMETNPVVTCFDGELSNLEGNIIRIYLRNAGEELPEDFIPPKKMYTVTAETLETVLPCIIKDLIIPSSQENKLVPIPSVSTKPDISSNASKNEYERSNDESMVVANEANNISSEIEKINDVNAPSATDKGIEVEVFTRQDIENIGITELEENACRKVKISSEKKISKPSDDRCSHSSKFQVIGLLDTGIYKDSGSEEGLHNTTEEFYTKEWRQKKDNDPTIIVDKELGSPSDFRSTPPPVSKKKPVDVRKSSRTRKPKKRSPFKSWDDLKIRLPRHKTKRTSKGPQETTRKLRAKKVIKKLPHKKKNVDSRN